MPNQNNKYSEHQKHSHDQVMLLLPCFVNQTMEESQRQEVYLHIKNCDECQHEIQFLRSLNEVIQEDAEQSYAEHGDVDKDLASVMNRIDTESTSINAVASDKSLLQQKLSELIDFIKTLSIPQWGATAMASVLVAVLGFQLLYAPPDDDYSVLSSSEMSNTSMKLSVEINPTENLEQVRTNINNELVKIGQQAEIETKKDGMTIVTFKDSIGVSELSKLIDDLKLLNQINHVEVLP